MKPHSSILNGLALGALLSLAGCQQILGLDGINKFTGDGGVDAAEPTEPTTEEDCDQYCTLLQDGCNPDSPYAAYREESYCRGACTFMRRTVSRNDVGNTFDCRLKNAQLAKNFGSDNERECKAAALGGNVECGTDCEGYCTLYAAVCADYPELQRGETCVKECEKLVVDEKNAKDAFSSNSDTLQCRMAHLGAAAASASMNVAASTQAHCGHSALQPPNFDQCFTPSCDSYCELVQNACTGPMQQYDSVQDCVAACNGGMVPGDPKLTTVAQVDKKDTVTCRRYHVYNHIRNGGEHCEHGGPVGDGHCGPICPAYCKLVKAACAKDYETKWATGDAADAACEAECAMYYGTGEPEAQTNDHYNVSKGAVDGDNMSCRVYHTIKAFRRPIECAAALAREGSACALR